MTDTDRATEVIQPRVKGDAPSTEELVPQGIPATEIDDFFDLTVPAE